MSDRQIGYFSSKTFSGAQAAGTAAAAVASGQQETAIEHIDYRNKLSEIRTIYHREVRKSKCKKPEFLTKNPF